MGRKWMEVVRKNKWKYLNEIGLGRMRKMDEKNG